ncbi:hypothetical protein PG994_010107 [Apiospora phragmitis]|uniref:Cullin family profile domain-containing protein n=1 Tax=Apiospora phragmitis TaxID=2905665 RepID=A0ABR1TP46_9PEZI
MPPPLPDHSSSPLHGLSNGFGSQNTSNHNSSAAAASGVAPVAAAYKRRQSDTRASEQDAKRARQGNPAPTTTTTETTPRMSKLLGKRPEIVDLTKPRSAIRPQDGVRKLVIKNLRTVNRTNDLDEYYSKTWSELDAAVQAIFARQQPQQPYAKLYRGVEDICRYGEAKKLYEVLRTHCETYLNGTLSDSIRAGAGSSNIEALRSVHKHWAVWNLQSATIRSTFSYLDRSFLLSSKEFPQLNDLAIGLFRRMVFVNSKIGPMVLQGMCELESISMLNVLNIYGKSFEPRFLETSESYFREFAEESSTASLKSYILACERLLEAEDHRCNAYNFDSTTKRQLMDKAHEILVENYSEKLLDSGSVGKLIDDNAVDSMKALYDLLRFSSIQKSLKEPWEDYIKSTGSSIVNDTSRGDEMVDDDFTYGLREAFGNFINDKKILSSWKTGTSKVGEMIAKYIDMLLRGGLKTIPKSLLSDNKDRAEAERSGQASTGDEDAELDRQLDQALELFRFIEGKDVFEAFYKQDLARRLLMSRSASADAERSMLTKLKSECGSSFTHNLEQMFKDQELARDEMASYKSWLENTGRDKSSVDLTVSILSAAAWPTYPDTQLRLPDEAAKQIETFEKYYIGKHTGRRLTWKHSLAHCVVKARFNKGPKELLVSAYQAVVLELFNQLEGKPDEVLSFAQIAEATGLNEQDLKRTLQSLARDVSETDTFTVNKGFADPKYRVKINQVQLKETKEENQDTHKRVAADRQFETQAAIVRIMKSRKTMTHANLVAEVINQTKSRGAVDTTEIKKNIEKLIEKDYLEREGGSYTYLA